MSLHNVYAATSCPKEEPFILRIRKVMAVWLFSVAHTRRNYVGAAPCANPGAFARQNHVGAVPCACPGAFARRDHVGAVPCACLGSFF